MHEPVSAVPLSEENKPEVYYEAPLLVCAGQANQRLDLLSESALGSWLVEQPPLSNDAISQHHMAWLRSGNRQRADTYRMSQHLTFNNYGEVFVGNPIDWMLGETGQANMSWQFHSFFFLRDFVASHRQTSDIGYLVACDELLDSWTNEALVSRPKPRFAWNDHSTAYRLHALTQYFVYLCCFQSPPKERLAVLYRLIVRHQAALLSGHLYSKGTNHGLDQAFYLYVSVVMVPLHSESERLREVALNRLRDELLRSFAPDGVHIENSPEYHDLVLSSSAYMSHVVQGVEGPSVIPGLQSVASDGIRFLAYIIRPDGYFPTIGDSTQIAPRSTHPFLSHTPFYSAFLSAKSAGVDGCDDLPACAVFRDSGYAIFRGQHCSVHEQRTHLVFKCGFLSTYHRHDDDNSVVLYADGEDWLVDGGLYRHEERDPQRQFLRSARAHNIMAPLGIESIRNMKMATPTGIVYHEITVDRAVVHGRTRMFPGFEYERSVEYDLYSVFRIHDTFSYRQMNSGYEQRYELLFQIPNDKSVQISSSHVLVESMRTGRSMSICFDTSGLCEVALLKPQAGGYHSRRSIAYDVIEDTQTVRVIYTGPHQFGVTTRIDLTDLSLKEHL